MWKNIIEPGRPQMTVQCIHRASWIPKATHTHPQYVTLITFYGNNGCTNMPQCYIIRTLSVLLRCMLILLQMYISETGSFFVFKLNERVTTLWEKLHRNIMYQQISFNLKTKTEPNPKVFIYLTRQWTISKDSSARRMC